MREDESVVVYDVFTPNKPARATFVERETINVQLVNAIQTPGKQIVIYGHSKSGKTTLMVNKLFELYSNHITTRCTTGMTYSEIVINAFDQLDRYYVTETTGTRRRQTSLSLEPQYSMIKAQLGVQSSSELQTRQQRVLPPQLSPQTLARFLGETDCCWVLEDFHTIELADKIRLAGDMKVFMDMADEHNRLKIVAVGAVDTAREVVELNPDMRTRVAEIHVPSMTDAEIMEIIKVGERILNFTIPAEIKSGIVRYSNGLGSVCHQLCLNICLAAGITEPDQERIEINGSELDSAIEAYVSEQSDTLKSTFDKAFRRTGKGQFDSRRLILSALTRYSSESGATRAEILAKITEEHPQYPSRQINTYLKQLQTSERGAIIRYDSTSGKYFYSDPIYGAYAMIYFDHERNNRITSQQQARDEVLRYLKSLLRNVD